jgi:hypothetical protein
VRSFKKSLIMCNNPHNLSSLKKFPNNLFLSAPCDLPWWWAFFQCGIFHCCKKENLKNLVASLMKILSKFGKLFLNVKIARFIYMVQVHNQNCIRIFKFFLIILGLGPRCFFWVQIFTCFKKSQ